MALIRLIGAEHLPNGIGVGNVNNCFGLSYADLGATAFWNASLTSYPNVGHLRIENNMISYCNVANTGAQGAGMATIPFLNLIGNIAPKTLILGFRITKLVLPIVATPIFALGTTTAAAASSGNNGTTLINFGTTDVLESAYYEIVFDLVGLTYTIYKNNAVFVAATALPSGVTQATIKNYYWSIGEYSGYNLAAASAIYFTITDGYVVADTGISGDAVITRQGPMIVKRVLMGSAVGAGWVASDGGSILTKVNTPRALGTLANPDIQSPSNLTPLILQPLTGMLPTGNLLGLHTSITPLKETATLGGLNANLQSGGVNGSVTTLGVQTSSAPIDQKISAVTAFPDTSAFTTANLANLSLVVTPT